RIGDLNHPETFRRRLKLNLDEYKARAAPGSALADLDLEQVYREQLEHFAQVWDFLVDASAVLEDFMAAGNKVLFEGAQGTLLDVDMGTYPYVTSSSATAGGACTGTGVGPTRIDGVLGVTKAYTTRVGEGPFPTEISGAAGEEFRRRGMEYGATTGRPRRCGWLDAVALGFAVRVNGLSTIALTKLDVLDTFPTIRICRAYRYRGERLTAFPNETEVAAACEPEYEELEGWQESTIGVRSLSELPKRCRTFLDRLATILERDISIVSTGAERDQTLMLPTPSLKAWGML
ncbi:MAG: adenylosuccinate synthetase, partial [Candidatus Methylomirabilales bacterium]